MMLSELSKSIARSVEVFPLFIHCNRDIEDKEMEYFIGALYDCMIKEYNHKYMVMTMMLMPVIMMMDIILVAKATTPGSEQSRSFHPAGQRLAMREQES